MNIPKSLAWKSTSRSSTARSVIPRLQSRRFSVIRGCTSQNDCSKIDLPYSQRFSSVISGKQARSYSSKVLSSTPFSPEIVKSLRAPLTISDVEIKPDGILYLPEIKYRRILNKSFGPGGWAMVPQGDFIIKDGFVCQQFALYADGRFVASSWGEQSYDEQKMRFKSLATALEGAKSNGLMRCCKDLGIASELWDPQYIIEWKKHYVAEVWATNKVTGKKKKLYRRKDRPPFEYPWIEEKVIEGGGASAEWVATFDVDNAADINREFEIVDEDEVYQGNQTQSQPYQSFNQQNAYANNQRRSNWNEGDRQRNIDQRQRQSQYNQSTHTHSQNTNQFNNNSNQYNANYQGKSMQSNSSQPPARAQQKQAVQFDDFEDEDDDFFATPTSTPPTTSANASKVGKEQSTKVQKPKEKAKPIDYDDHLDSDGEPDMFADFNDEPEDTVQDDNVPTRNQDMEDNSSSEPNFNDFQSSDGGDRSFDFDSGDDVFAKQNHEKQVTLNLNEVVFFGKYKGKTWNDILRDRSFLNYAKWAESKMRPGEVRDKIIAAYKLAREMQDGNSNE